jgi:hypothetical protein
VHPASTASCSNSLSTSERAASANTKYMVRGRRPPSQSWRTFLDNHLPQLVSIDFFTVPTLSFQVLYVFLFWPMTGCALFTSYLLIACPDRVWTPTCHRSFRKFWNRGWASSGGASEAYCAGMKNV